MKIGKLQASLIILASTLSSNMTSAAEATEVSGLRGSVPRNEHDTKGASTPAGPANNITSSDQGVETERELATLDYRIEFSSFDPGNIGGGKGWFELTRFVPATHSYGVNFNTGQIWVEFVDTKYDVRSDASPSAYKEQICPSDFYCPLGQSYTQRYDRRWADRSYAIPKGTYHVRLAHLTINSAWSYDPPASRTIYATSKQLVPGRRETVRVEHCTYQSCKKQPNDRNCPGCIICADCPCGWGQTNWRSQPYCHRVGFV